MKKHKKINLENGTERGSKTPTKHHQNGVRGGRAECLHPAQHSLQHITLQIVAHSEKGKVPAAKKKKGACGEGA